MPKILVKNVPKVTLTSEEYEYYCKKLESVVEKGVLFCRQSSEVHNELTKMNKDDPKIIAAAYKYCTGN